MDIQVGLVLLVMLDITALVEHFHVLSVELTNTQQQLDNQVVKHVQRLVGNIQQQNLDVNSTQEDVLNVRKVLRTLD